MKHWFLAKQYILYKIKALGPHALHSPFVFNFMKDVLLDKRKFYAFETIRTLRAKLYADDTQIEIKDFGAGSLTHNTRFRKISDIAKNAGRSEKLGELLFRIINYFNITAVLELGTSLGLSSTYMAMANTNTKILTIEGSELIAAQAKSNFESLHIQNIKQLIGNFDHILPDVLQQENFDLIFIDGNHRKNPTLAYFNMALPYAQPHSIFIFDDIHWSHDMLEAWQEIKSHPQVTCSVDIFYFGIVFFNPDFKIKQDFTLKFA